MQEYFIEEATTKNRIASSWGFMYAKNNIVALVNKHTISILKRKDIDSLLENLINLSYRGTHNNYCFSRYDLVDNGILTHDEWLDLSRKVLMDLIKDYNQEEMTALYKTMNIHLPSLEKLS